ncbi:MAG TPA: pitrilysin family protein [Thermoanaerobaculia bacterium]|nr:pitrilysin family protein [Thermoanaerobaculia bacterium]
MTAVRTTASTVVLLILLAAAASAQDLAAFEKRTTMKTLDNGLTVIIYERPETPVFSYATVVNAGSAQEVPGITGLAHMFEHMAFKGNDMIGTKDWAAEQEALRRVEEAYAAFDRERRRETGRDEQRLEEREQEWRDAIAAAGQFVVTDEFTKLVDAAGGVGINAFTASDITAYYFSLPSNRFELWAYLESERYRAPFLREFYKERDVVMEERRMRTESRPVGRLLEQFLGTAFIAHPYGVSTVGHMSDLQSFSATDAVEFFNRYYVPANMVITIVGDVKAAQAMPVIEKYFGRLPKAPPPEPLRTVEPPQRAERTVILREAAQPIYLEGYHRPSVKHPDDPVYTAMAMLMSTGRTSRLYKSLVRDQKLAVQASGFNGFPGEKYTNLFTFFLVPAAGKTAAEMSEPLRAEIERLKNEDVTAEELASVKTRAKASLLRRLDSNSGLALQLAIAHTIRGDWRELFRAVERIDKVTPADIRRVANATFIPGNRTVGMIERQAPPAAAAQGGAE